MNKELIRQEILKFLQWNDSNGCYLDEYAALEGFKPITYEESLVHFYYVLYEDKPFYLNLEEPIYMDYKDILPILKENKINDNINAYDYANSFIEELVSSINKEEVYKKIIKAI